MDMRDHFRILYDEGRRRKTRKKAVSSLGTILIVALIAGIVVVEGLFILNIGGSSTYSSQSSSSGLSTITSTTVSAASVTLPPIPAPKGFIGANYTSSGMSRPLAAFKPSGNISNPGIPQSENVGYFSFAFSNSTYSQSDFSVLYQSCSPSMSDQQSSTSSSSAQSVSTIDTNTVGTGSGSGSAQQFCSITRTSLNFSYGENSESVYVVTTNDITLPCGNVQVYNGNSVPTEYYLVTFSVETLGQPSALPYSYQYIVYANC